MDNLNKLYVGLDAILDLRLGVLNYISADFAFAVTSQPEYFKREEDRFASDAPISAGVSQPWGQLAPQAYQQVFDTRPDEIVRGAVETRINKFVRVLCAAHWQNTMREGQDLTVEIEVNLFPYHFDDESIEALGRMMQAYFGSHFRVNLVSIPWDKLTMDLVRQNYFGMVMYDYVTWVNSHEVALKKKPLASTCLYVPRLYFNGKPPAEEMAKFEERKMDPFEFNSRVLMPLLPVQYLPVAFFSAATPHNLDEYTAASR